MARLGGFGSGRPSSGRFTVESCPSLDVNRLHKAGRLRRGWVGSMEWTSQGEFLPSAKLGCQADGLRLSFRLRNRTGEFEEVGQTVRIVYLPCTYGGTRPYFVCPGVVDGRSCQRRVAKLYWPGRYFLCRHCYQLTYASQGEGRMHRGMRRANKICRLLGGDPDVTWEVPPKPKGMWRRTYDRLRHRMIQAEMGADQALTDWAAEFNGRTRR